MHRFQVTFTKTRAQLVELELDGSTMIGVGKQPNQSAWVLTEQGDIESRLYGRYVMPSLFVPAPGFTEADAFARLEAIARDTVPVGHPRLVVIRMGELRGYMVLCTEINPATGDGVEDAYMPSLPALRL